MANVREAVHTCAGADGTNPGAPVGALNTLAAETGVGEMTTLIYVALDIHTGRLRLSNAGHCPPLLLDGNGDADRRVANEEP
jgi:serine phosphatase RsbU (regulator of sigma subunit)